MQSKTRLFFFCLALDYTITFFCEMMVILGKSGGRALMQVIIVVFNGFYVILILIIVLCHNELAAMLRAGRFHRPQGPGP